MKRVALVAALAALCTTMIQAAPSQPSMPQVLSTVDRLHGFGGAAISPDGTRVVWQEDVQHRSALWVEDLATHRDVQLSAGAGQESDGTAVWSPDGKRLAFFSTKHGDTYPALWVIDADGTNARRLAPLGGIAQRLTWSPDGTRLGFLYIAHPHRPAGATSVGAREVGVIGTINDEQQIATVNASSGALTVISPAEDYVYEYAWSPNASRFAATYARGNGDNNWWIAKLATIASSGGRFHDVLAPKFQINDPQWSPDGKIISVIGGLMSDFGSVGGDVYLVDPRNGTATDATAQANVSVADVKWVTPDRFDVVAHVKGALHILSHGVSGGKTATLLGGEGSLRSFSLSNGGKVAALVRQSWNAPAEVWAGPIGALTQITNVNAKVPRLYGKAVSLTWKSDRFTPQGWLIYPLGFDPSKKYPMITIIHGGPSAESLPGYDSRFVAALTARGFFVFEPNPRGSFGQGEAFTAANVKDFGYGDWRDDLAGVSAAIASAPIDPHRLGLFGWSYGGYMGMWAETQTTRFKAIVVGAGVVNWQSYYGQNNIDQWMLPFFGASVYDDPAVYAKSSPITFIKHSHTPVLILQGERDEEVPAPQAFEFYHAMQTLDVPSRLVVYADEGHGPRKPADQIDILNRTVGWFNEYLR